MSISLATSAKVDSAPTTLISASVTIKLHAKIGHLVQAREGITPNHKKPRLYL